MPWQFFYLFLFFHVSLRHGLEELVTIPYINYQTIWKHKVSVYIHNSLTLSWRRPLSYRNQSVDLRSKSMGWFLYDNGLHHEMVKRYGHNMTMHSALFWAETLDTGIHNIFGSLLQEWKNDRLYDPVSRTFLGFYF